MEEKLLSLTNEAIKYLTENRSLSLKTLQAYKISCNYRGEISVPFFDDQGKLWLIKNRSANGGMLKRQRIEENKSITEYEVKTDSVPGGKPILLGSHLPHNGTIYICYGDYDALSLYEAGVHGACSMPFGDRGTNWIDKQWDWLQTAQTIIFCPDYDENPKVQAHLMAKLEEISKRLGKHRCFLVPEHAMLACKDMNELLVEHGKEAIVSALSLIIPVPEPGLSRLIDYRNSPIVPGTPIGIPETDKATGGHGGSQLIILSGDNNAGKTTEVLNMIANFVDAGERCFFWSGEQKPDKIRWWFEQIVAGPHNLESKISQNTGREYWYADPKKVTAIRQWYANKVFVYDKRGIDPEQFFSVAELAVRRYGVTKIFIDNLMAFTGGEENYYQAQGAFAESCKNFAEDWDVNVLLVAHNKKSDDFPDKDSVEGSKKVTNWADLVYQLIRVNEKNRKKEWGDANSILSLCKNRETEDLVDVRLFFDPRSKRLVQLSNKDDVDKVFGWEEKLENEVKINF